MPLTFPNKPHRYDAVTRTVVFFAEDLGGKRVTCAVSEEGLADLTRSQVMGEAVAPLYLENAALIQGIAAAKYDARRFGPDGVVRVTSGDLAPYG